MSGRTVLAGILGATLIIASAPFANAFTGRHLISAEGAIRESTESETGTIGLSGLIDFDTKGGASAVDITIALVDSGGDTISCVLSTPADVAYTLSKEGIGTLTLTVASGDTCTTGNTGNSITFNFAVLGNTGRVTATSIDLVDSMGDVVDLTTLTGAVLAQ
ncbi:MAG TPA: hypothetical protein VKR29_09800 [Candidatus Binataceae bacterium]|nr:hypothetical protein [Candidatus Binataceae bacterium]